ncbi:acyl-CoA dehydrogenase family protein [Marinomonas aquiplantarum]|uniref:Alkylation response protein AidB-like acyl-CoA dehydrogenase n=1 Tax=Marinomonas aquiplantarum TaxID=491951 RepID=A0A366CT78_9GAMM|nr:acyl-CoA dehydrogenase family protein [Marinomonas aquiplantarum]RBO78405.1 alkylation response protein AidB-like acyl-CoA dehydrogenase [Marinomonas aquiplantarum]
MSHHSPDSISAQALKAAGDHAQAEDVAALEQAADAAGRHLATTQSSLIERMIYGPKPDIEELLSGVDNMKQSATSEASAILQAGLSCLEQGDAFGEDGRITSALRNAVAKEGAYGFTVPTQYGGQGKRYSEFACLMENFAANGLGALSVEISGQLTIGSSALLGYGTETQKSKYLPAISGGQLIAFALTEVGVGVNAKRVKAYVEEDKENACWRLFAEGECNKLYITSATHGGLMAIVARKGKDSKELALFITELPESDIDGEFSFHCQSSNVSAFQQNINSRIHFKNFPIPYEQEILGNGVEVLFYCLRMGRCMLAAQAAGFQRMMAADAVYYATQREGVGGKVIKHELPRLALAKILGGALTAQALSHLALAQDQDKVDLAGLRDVTKSASAHYLLNSLIACERVMGGRSLDKGSRISDIRATAHAFGIVEGEDDLIRLGMVRDLTKSFTENYMAGLLHLLQRANMDKNGQPVVKEKHILKLSLGRFIKSPIRMSNLLLSLASNAGVWRLLGWVARNLVSSLIDRCALWFPSKLMVRYKSIPSPLKSHLRFAEYQLRKCRWHYFKISAAYQLELTQAQLPLQRLGKRIETLMCIATLCAHASQLDESTQRVALAQIEILRSELEGNSMSVKRMESLRIAVKGVAKDLSEEQCSLIKSIKAQPFAHPWDE